MSPAKIRAFSLATFFLSPALFSLVSFGAPQLEGHHSPRLDSFSPHVVFDLDGTLVQTATTEAQAQDPADPLVIARDGEALRLNDFAPEVIAQLIRAGYRISFFSGSPRPRIDGVVERLQELIRVRSNIELKPYKVLTSDDLTPVLGVPETARYRDRFRKDVQKIDNPGNVVLVDDIPEYILHGEERSLLQLNPAANTVRTRQKLLVIMEILLEARELQTRMSVSYLNAVRGLAHGTAPGANYDDAAYLELMRKALQRFQLPLLLNEPAYPVYLKSRSCQAVFSSTLGGH